MKNFRDLCRKFAVDSIGNIHWVHAVNCRNLLDQVISDSSVHMVEGDVSRSKTGELIMAHPPKTEGDVTLGEWVSQLTTAGKGMKIDIKTPDCLDDCISLLRKRHDGGTPLMVNADVLRGPGGRLPVWDPVHFIKHMRRGLPHAICSPGWTTECLGGLLYTEEMVREMAALAKNCDGLITFPVRACYLLVSWSALRKLLQNDRHSLTIWNRESVDGQTLSWIGEQVLVERLFVDLLLHVDPIPLGVCGAGGQLRSDG